MNSSTSTEVARQAESLGRRSTAAGLVCFLILALFTAVGADAQSTTTVQAGGTPNAANPQVVSNYTVPRGAIVLTGTALNPTTHLPVRHLWVGDNVMGLCRIDPDLDTPGIKAINPNTCPFKLNGQSVAAGPLSYDPINQFLYLADVRRSQGVFRIKYDPNADGGNGNLDLTSIFAMAGNPTGARFQGGQTGCQFPSLVPAGSVALGPDGNLWVSFAKGPFIVRINNPATATSTGFGTCADFVQVVASSPDGRRTNDLAWTGHDLWSIDGTSPFVITNADTTCQAITPGMTPTCTAVNTLAAVGGANTTASDQVYPQLNGNNLYFGLSAVVVAPTAPGQVFWVADAEGAQIVDPNFISQADIAASLPPTFPPPNPYPLGAMSESGVDYNDPANLVVYTGDDPSNNGVTIVGPPGSAPGLGLGRWWKTCLGTAPVVADPFATNVLAVDNCPTPAATAIPGAPTVARAKATGSLVAVSWSAAQSQQPVTSYRVRTLANAVFLSDTIVTPAAGTAFPPTTTTISGLASGPLYSFQVSAINAIGESGFSPLSNSVTVPGIDPPGIPTRVTATAGDKAAFVSWFPPASSGGAPITSYTVTAIDGAVRTNIISSVAAPATSAVINGLTDGRSYSFSVHATNSGGNGLESTPSNSVTPAVVPALSATMGGPTSLTTTPIQVTYPISITNNGILAVTALKLVDTLTTTDGAFILLAQPTQGSCSTGGTGVTTVTCNLGTLAAGATAKVNVIVQIQGAAVTNTANVSALDNANVLITTSASQTTAPPPPPTVNITAPVSVTGNAQVPVPNVGQAGNIVWTITDTSLTVAQNVVFQTNVPSNATASMQLNSITVTVNNSGTFVCTFTPTGGTAVPCASAPVNTAGGTILVTTPSLGGSTKNGNKPPQTMIVTVNVTNPAGTTRGTIFNATGTMTFGPGGVDTLPNTATVKITSN